MAPGLLRQDTPFQDEADDVVSTLTYKSRLYILDQIHPAAIKHAQQLFDAVLPTDPEIHSWRENAEYLIIKGSSIPGSDIRAARKLRAIGKQGVGTDRIDTEACKVRNIKVLNTPGANSAAVAELVLALALSVARELGSIQVRLSNGEIVTKQICSGQTLSGKTLGLIGMGNIGKGVARIFRGAFASPIIAYDPFLPNDAWEDVPHTRTKTPAEVIASADVLSIHVPLTDATRDMITYRAMTTMKRNAIIINAARGGIINEADLCTALTEGVIWGAGIDCHEEEPPTKERYGGLWSHPRVVATPHIGAATDDTQMQSAKAAIDRVYEYIHSSV